MAIKNSSTEAKKLLAALDEIDKKIQDKLDILKKNNVDMDTPLVDVEGFPSATIDVVSVRKARHDIICLRNDRNKLMNEMEEALVLVHQSSKSSHTNLSMPEEEVVHRTSNKPFAKIDSVEQNSPAEKAQLEPGDLIVQLGNLHAGNFEGFQQLKKYVQDSVNTTLKLTVFRPDNRSGPHVFRLELRPQGWSGAGIVGCSFSPVKDE